MQVKQIAAKLQDFTAAGGKLSHSTTLMIIILFAAASFLLTLFLPSVGEEGVYTNITLEMLHNNDYLVPTLYNMQYYRPPLFNWLILAVTNLLGPAQVVVAARIVNMVATLATAALLMWFVRRIFRERQFALLTAAIYLSGDLLFRRGWLAYSDSLFSLCIFASIVCLWMALENQQRRWLVAATLSLCCGFLAKVQTAYIFYAVAGLVLLWRHPNRKFLFTPTSWLVHFTALAFPFIWTMYVNKGYGGLSTTWLSSQSFLAWPGLFAYLFHICIEYPVNVLMRFLPLSLIAVVVGYKLWSKHQPTAQHAIIGIVFWITVLNMLPYWLAPTSNIRYILPLYPFLAILFAFVIWQSSDRVRRFAINCLIATVILKYIFALWWLPYEHAVYRGNALTVASDVLQRSKASNLYINDSTATGLRVAVELNRLRYPDPPLTLAPKEFSGYVLADRNDPLLGELAHVYNLRSNKLYLFFKASPS